MLEVGWWGWGVIKGSFQKHLKTGWVKAKVVRRGRGVLKVSPSLLPPPENFNRTQALFKTKTEHWDMIILLL